MRLAHSMADTLVTPINDSFLDFEVLATLDPINFAVIRLFDCVEQRNALPLPGFFAWPGGQKPYDLAPRFFAFAAR